MEMKGGTPIITGEIDLGGYAQNLRVIKDQPVTQRLQVKSYKLHLLDSQVSDSQFATLLPRELQPLNWASLYGM